MAYSYITNFTALAGSQFRINLTAFISDTAGTTSFTQDATLAGTGTYRLKGTTASGNVKTNVCAFRVPVPNGYVAGTDLSLKVTAYTSPTALVSCSVDAEVYIVDTDGTADGSDLVSTAAQDINSATPAEISFTVAGASIVAADELLVIFKTVNTDTGGTSGSIAYLTLARFTTALYGGVAGS